MQITALLFRSDALQSHRDQARTPPPHGPRKILQRAGFSTGAGLSLGRWAPRGTMSLAQWEPNGYEDSQLQELGQQPSNPGLGFQAEGVGRCYICSPSPETLAPKRATDHLQLRVETASRPSPPPSSRNSRSPGRLLPCTALPHTKPARAQGQLRHGGLG